MISESYYYEVGNRTSTGKWPAVKVTRTVLSEHDTVSEAAAACRDDDPAHNGQAGEGR